MFIELELRLKCRIPIVVFQLPFLYRFSHRFSNVLNLDRPPCHRRVEESFPKSRFHSTEARRHCMLPADVAVLVAATHRHQSLLENLQRNVAQRWKQRTRSLDWSSDGETPVYLNKKWFLNTKQSYYLNIKENNNNFSHFLPDDKFDISKVVLRSQHIDKINLI